MSPIDGIDGFLRTLKTLITSKRRSIDYNAAFFLIFLYKTCLTCNH